MNILEKRKIIKQLKLNINKVLDIDRKEQISLVINRRFLTNRILFQLQGLGNNFHSCLSNQQGPM